MNRIWIIILGDSISFWISFLISLFIRFGETSYSTALQIHIIPFAILYFFWILIFFLFGLYDLLNIKPTIPYLKQFGGAIFVFFAIEIFFFYLIPFFGITPKIVLVIQILIFSLISFFFRRLMYIIFSKNVNRPVIFVGKDKIFSELEQMINKNPQIGIQIISHESDLLEAIKKNPNQENLLFILGNVSNEIPEKYISLFYKNKLEIIDIVEAYETYLQKIPIEYTNQSWIIKNIKIKENIIYIITKKIMDTLVALFILILTSPVVIICSLFIYLYDHKTIFYIQKRVGINGKVFKLYKLRSMIINSESNGAVWTGKKDPRITPIGKIIRSLHIDEIPQMINIIKGDISLVGPRPERPEFVSQLENTIPHYHFRHIIRPGFTGWAQIKYRYARTTEESKEKFEYDLYYIKNRNIFIDLGIIIRTIQIIFIY